MKKIIILLVLITVVACGKSNEKQENDYMKPASTGRINHVVVVVDDHLWSGPAGDALRNVIQKPIPGLPQRESRFDVTTVPSSAFTKMFKKCKNLLFFQIADTRVFNLSSNKYAQPQKILEVKATSANDLIALVQEKESEIIEAFREGDLKDVHKDIAKNKFSNKINALSTIGINMDIHKKYRVVMDTLGSFMWMRSRIAGGIAKGDQSNNIIVYEAPMFNKKEPVLNQIIKNRDSIGKSFIRGNDTETMYMITEKARVPSVRITTINGKKAYESRGTWEVFGSYSAGPFLNYSIVDEENNRVVVVEGFNYAPSVNKRDFVFELEAILTSTEFH